jgi:cytosine/uracil/thiamine/allantoin permease
MQLLVIVAVIPWLILMSRSNFYSFCRITGAILAAVAAVGWILERLKEESNIITELISKLANHSIWLLCFLVVFSLVSYYLKKLDTK